MQIRRRRDVDGTYMASLPSPNPSVATATLRLGRRGSKQRRRTGQKGRNLLSVEIFLRMPWGVGYTCGGWLVKGSAARVVAAQKLRSVPSKSLGSVIAGDRSRQLFCSAVQMRKS